ncbi:hypothetical protein [Dorea sp. D27]|uniref:hypothetical protein n=1 Tax=Dorea sp. D27 TaxID=658665 RepID=UPI0006A13E62|nr:hypothetical protein [Dorea sp. D27]KMZ52331.1 PE-PGRS family protein [Dorea sp. D27]
MTMREKITEQIQAFRAAIYGEDVRDAYADIAETVCIEAMEELDAAVEKGNYAEAQGNYAKNQGDYAKGKGDYAGVQGDEAGKQAAYAKAEGDRVDNLCRSYTEIESACRNATDASVKQTHLCEDATQRAIEAATGYSIIYDPTDGERKTTQETINNIWQHTIAMFGSPITADELDALEITADELDAKNIPAFEFDIRAKALLTGGN